MALEVWRSLGRLFLPKWDLDFMRRGLWINLPRMGHLVGSKLCPLCHKPEDLEHVLRHFRSFPFKFDTVRKAFGLLQREGGAVEPSRVLLEDLPCLQTTQGLVLWSVLKAQWSLQCEVRFQGAVRTVDDFVARWLGVWEVWRGEKDLSLSRMDV